MKSIYIVKINKYWIYEDYSNSWINNHCFDTKEKAEQSLFKLGYKWNEWTEYYSMKDTRGDLYDAEIEQLFLAEENKEEY